MPALIYDYSVQNLYFKIFMSGSDTVLSEDELCTLFGLTNQDIGLLVESRRIKFLFICQQKLYFRLGAVVKWLENAYRDAA